MGNACSCFGKDNKQEASNTNLNSNKHSSQSVSTRTSRKSAVRLNIQEIVQHVRDGPRESLDQEGKDKIQELLKASQNLKLNRKRFSEVYTLSKKIGQGGYSVVRKCMHNQTQEVYAVKIMDLPYEGQVVDSNSSSREDIFKEIEIVTEVEHPNIVYLKEFFVEENKVYLVMEFLGGGELLDAVLSMGMYTEADARIIFRQILRALEYLHAHNVVHRDLKLENFLLVQPGDINRIKLADFGLAKLLKWGTMETVCGTPNYVAPEVITFKKDTQYTSKVDIWSAGVIMYILLSGEPPFRDDNETLIFRRIRKFKYSLDDRVWKGITEEAKDLVRHLLCPVDVRYTATEALKHPWLQNLDILEQQDQNNPLNQVNLSFRFNKNDVQKWKQQDSQMSHEMEKQYYKQRPGTARYMHKAQLLDEEEVDDLVNRKEKQAAKPASLDLARDQDQQSNRTSKPPQGTSNTPKPGEAVNSAEGKQTQHTPKQDNYRFQSGFNVQQESPSLLIDEELNRVESEYDQRNIKDGSNSKIKDKQQQIYNGQVQGQNLPSVVENGKAGVQNNFHAAQSGSRRYNRIVLRMWKKAYYKVVVAQGLRELFLEKANRSKPQLQQQGIRNSIELLQDNHDDLVRGDQERHGSSLDYQ